MQPSVCLKVPEHPVTAKHPEHLMEGSFAWSPERPKENPEQAQHRDGSWTVMLSRRCLSSSPKYCDYGSGGDVSSSFLHIMVPTSKSVLFYPGSHCFSDPVICVPERWILILDLVGYPLQSWCLNFL